MRKLHIGVATDVYVEIPLLEKDAEELEKALIIYTCGDGDGHDLHLYPDYDFELTQVEKLCVAINAARGAE